MAEPGIVVVTGAAGRIGRVISPALREAGLRLRLTDIAGPGAELGGFDYVRADICDPVAMRQIMNGAETLIHLAGMPGMRDWAVLEQINVSGTRIVFEAAVAQSVRRIVYASTNHVCGFNPADVLLGPDTPICPDSAYGVTKLFGENLLMQLCDTHGLIGISLRIGSFVPQPSQVRHLTTWLSYADTARLALAAATAQGAGHRPIWGLSDNRRAQVDRDHWTRIGYVPQDDAERFAAELAAAGADTGLVSEWPFLGGSLAVPVRSRGDAHAAPSPPGASLPSQTAFGR